MEDNISSTEKNDSKNSDTTGWKSKIFSVKNKERLNKTMKLAKTWWLFFAVLVIWIGVTQYIVAEKYQAVVKVVGGSGQISANVTAGGLDFGSLPRGDSSTRFVTIENNGKRDVYVKIYKWGGINKFIETNRDNFVLEAGKNENLEFLLEIPSGAAEKEYQGKIIVFEIPKFL